MANIERHGLQDWGLTCVRRIQVEPNLKVIRRGKPRSILAHRSPSPPRTPRPAARGGPGPTAYRQERGRFRSDLRIPAKGLGQRGDDEKDSDRWIGPHSTVGPFQPASG